MSFAQETPDPRPQPSNKPIEITAWDTPPAEKQTGGTSSLVATASTQPGQTPTASPEANFINRFQDVSVNLFTGALNLPIPIYTLSEAGGASVPIYIANNSSGMCCSDVAGWVGINNTLVAGGQINRIVRGIPDEGKFSITDYTSYDLAKRKGFYQHGLYEDSDIENDSQPDLLFLNINSQTYKFSFDENHKAHFYP